MFPFGFDFAGSDHHFWHKRIIQYSGRPFESLEQMCEELVRRHNAIVKPHHTYVALGDLALGDLAMSIPYTSQLNGKKFLVPGNHDRVSRAHREGKQIELYRERYEAAGWTILPEVVEAQVDGIDILLSHFPYTGDSRDNERYGHLRAKDEGLPIVHGHVHTEWAAQGRQFNVGVDVHNFTPVPVTTISDWARAL